MTLNLDALVKEYSSKTEQELRNLYAFAQQHEAQAKQDLYMLRKRIANLPTDRDDHEENDLVAAKKVVADANIDLQAIETVLGSAAKSGPTTTPVVTSDALPELKPEVVAQSTKDSE